MSCIHGSIDEEEGYTAMSIGGTMRRLMGRSFEIFITRIGNLVLSTKDPVAMFGGIVVVPSLAEQHRRMQAYTLPMCMKSARS